MTTERLTAKQVAFEIRFALGQAGATHFINAHAKSPEARLKAIDALTAIVAARFDKLVVTRELPESAGQATSSLAPPAMLPIEVGAADKREGRNGAGRQEEEACHLA